MELKVEINISTTVLNVWDIITNPISFNSCFRNLIMEMESLNIGSNIYFIEINTKKIDTATILGLCKDKILSYKYFKNTNATPIDCTFKIESLATSSTKLIIEAKNFSSENEFIHSKQTGRNMLLKQKEHLE